MTLSNGERLTTRKLLLATGVIDELPEIEGLSEFYGSSVFHCPYCDGWEMRDEPLAVYGQGENGLGLALELTFWSGNLVLCTDGPAELSGEDVQRLKKRNIPLNENKIARLEGNAGVLERIVFADGESLPVRGMFFSTGQSTIELPQKLGCTLRSRAAFVLTITNDDVQVVCGGRCFAFRAVCNCRGIGRRPGGGRNQ